MWLLKAKGLGFRVSGLLDVGPPSRHPHRRVPWAPEVSQTSLHACVRGWVRGCVCARARAYTHDAKAQARGRGRCTWCLCRHSRIAQLDGRPACPSPRATRVSVLFWFWFWFWFLVVLRLPCEQFLLQRGPSASIKISPAAAMVGPRPGKAGTAQRRHCPRSRQRSLPRLFLSHGTITAEARTCFAASRSSCNCCR